MYVTTDLYKAKRPNKPRIVLRYKIKHAVACMRVCTVCMHLEQAFETLFEKMKLDTDVLEETFSL